MEQGMGNRVQWSQIFIFVPSIRKQAVFFFFHKTIWAIEINLR